MAESRITIRGQINTRYEMRRAGYKFTGHAKCKGCQAAIEWWLSNHGKRLAFDPIFHDEALTELHWRTCPTPPTFARGGR